MFLYSPPTGKCSNESRTLQMPACSCLRERAMQGIQGYLTGSFRTSVQRQPDEFRTSSVSKSATLRHANSSRIICAKILGNMFSTAHHYANVIMLNWYTLGRIIANKMHRIAIFTLAPKKCGFILYKRTLVSRVHRVP